MKALLFSILPSFLKVMILKAKGHRIGANVSIGFGARIHAEYIQIGDNCRFLPFSRTITKKLTMGRRCVVGIFSKLSARVVTMGHECILGKSVVVGGRLRPNSALIMGNRCVISNNTYVDTTDRVQLDDEAGIGANSFVFTHACGHAASDIEGFPRKIGPVHIKTRAWVPWHVFIMPGVTLGEFCIVSSGSVVGQDIPDYALAAGTPCRIVATKGGHMEKRSPEEKLAMAKGILDEFHEYRHDEALPMVMDKVIFWESIPHDVAVLDTVVSWEEISESVLIHLESKGVSWFDLARRRCGWNLTKIGKDVRNHFSWHGVLFSPSSITEAITLPPEPVATLPISRATV